MVRSFDAWEWGPFWWKEKWWKDVESAPPVQAVLPVAGWVQQTASLPWLPISPFTISKGTRYGKSRTRREPKTFKWIIEHDAAYVKLVLEYVGRHKTHNMQQLYMYIREHYEPTHWKRYSDLEEMQDQLAEWRSNITEDFTVEETRRMAAFRLKAIAKKMTIEAESMTVEAARATEEAAWMTAEAARVTAEAAGLGIPESSTDDQSMELQPKKARI